MVLRIDPAIPLVWRTPDSIQFGVDAPLAVVDGLTAPAERLVAALIAGISESGLAMIARSSGAAAGELERLLDTLGPVLAHPSPPKRAAVLVDGTGPTASLLQRLLGTANEEPDIVVLVDGQVTCPERAARWLRRDVPHLPVVYGDREARIGPMVEPGAGPCVRCLELHRRDADPAWPAIASQLLGRRSTIERPLLAAEVAATATRLVLRRIADGPTTARSIAIAAEDGSRREREWEPHPECGCIGLETGLSAARPGTGTATSRLPDPPRSRPSSSAAAGAPG